VFGYRVCGTSSSEMLGIEYKNYTVAVDADKCVACGACAAICSMGIIEVGEKAVLAHPEKCIGCAHCTAVCPTRAIHSVKRANAPEDQPAPVPTEDFGDKKPFVPFEDLARHVAARRSVRNFTDEIPSRELLEKVLMASRYAPTACNYRLLKFALVTDPEHIKTIREICMKRYPMPRVLLPSPCLFLVMGPKFAQEDVSIASTTFDLVARSAGLGCTFAGLIKMAISELEELRNYLRDSCGIKAVDEGVVSAMYLGFPAPEASFLRPAVREPPQVTWA